METTLTFKFRWGKKACAGKHDPAHTISGLDADQFLDYWIKCLRPGTPWQLVADDNTIIREGVR